jgi:hypothetical protein
VKHIYKEMLLVYSGKNLSHKAFHILIEKRDKFLAHKEEIETELRKGLRQQSNDLYARGFDALVKRWYKCVTVCGGYVEK